MDIAEIEAKLKDHEKRIADLEDRPKPKKTADQRNHLGVNAGVQLLIDEGFLDTPKSLAEIQAKLKEKAYNHKDGAVATALAKYFMKRDQKLTRTKEDSVYRYAVRK